MLGWFSPTVFVITEQYCDCLLMFPCLNDKNKTKFSGLQESQKNHYFEKLKGSSLEKDVLQIFFKVGTIDSHFYDTVIKRMQTRELA